MLNFGLLNFGLRASGCAVFWDLSSGVGMLSGLCKMRRVCALRRNPQRQRQALSLSLSVSLAWSTAETTIRLLSFALSCPHGYLSSRVERHCGVNIAR